MTLEEKYERAIGYLADLTIAAEQHIKPGMDDYAHVVAARQLLDEYDAERAEKPEP